MQNHDRRLALAGTQRSRPYCLEEESSKKEITRASRSLAVGFDRTNLSVPLLLDKYDRAACRSKPVQVRRRVRLLCERLGPKERDRDERQHNVAACANRM